MSQTPTSRIDRAKELLETMKHACMATVNEDNTPHITPFMFLYDKPLKHIYWGSHPDSLHSKNILRTGQAFMVVYDSAEGGGLYMKTDNVHPLEGEELKAALKIHNATRAARGQDSLSLDYYTGDSPQRMWSATPVKFWVNDAERDADGHISRDFRVEINREDLV